MMNMFSVLGSDDEDESETTKPQAVTTPPATKKSAAKQTPVSNKEKGFHIHFFSLE